MMRVTLHVHAERQPGHTRGHASPRHSLRRCGWQWRPSIKTRPPPAAPRSWQRLRQRHGAPAGRLAALALTASLSMLLLTRHPAPMPPAGSWATAAAAWSAGPTTTRSSWRRQGGLKGGAVWECIRRQCIHWANRLGAPAPAATADCADGHGVHPVPQRLEPPSRRARLAPGHPAWRGGAGAGAGPAGWRGAWRQDRAVAGAGPPASHSVSLAARCHSAVLQRLLKSRSRTASGRTGWARGVSASRGVGSAVGVWAEAAGARMCRMIARRGKIPGACPRCRLCSGRRGRSPREADSRMDQWENQRSRGALQRKGSLGVGGRDGSWQQQQHTQCKCRQPRRATTPRLSEMANGREHWAGV